MVKAEQELGLRLKELVHLFDRSWTSHVQVVVVLKVLSEWIDRQLFFEGYSAFLVHEYGQVVIRRVLKKVRYTLSP